MTNARIRIWRFTNLIIQFSIVYKCAINLHDEQEENFMFLVCYRFVGQNSRSQLYIKCLYDLPVWQIRENVVSYRINLTKLDILVEKNG